MYSRNVTMNIVPTCRPVVEQFINQKFIFRLLQETKEALDPLMHGKYRHLVQYHTIYDLITTVHSLSDALHHRLLNNRRTPEFYGDKREPLVGFTEAEVAANKVLNLV